MTPTAYQPPRPRPLSPIASLMRTIAQGDGDLLSLLPADAYRRDVTDLGYSRRSIVLFNEPELVRQILADADGIFPKNDLMVGALEPLIGNSIFVTDGDVWRRQRAMIEPAFTHMRVNHAFAPMQAAVADYEARLDRHAHEGTPLSLDRAMSQLTADIICRTVFSTSLDNEMAHEIFDDFAVFERAVASVNLSQLILKPAWSKVRQPAEVLAACQRIRAVLGVLVDTHLEDRECRFNDIASAVIAARDADTGDALTREQLIDQLGVFFLAGHETTASVLTWVFFILACQPQVLAAIRAEVAEVTGGAPLQYEHARRLPFLRSVFKEALRLYPPVTFIPRVALEAVQIGPRKLKRGAMVMISPWTMHRHQKHWADADLFDPQRFMPEREAQIPKGVYIPFGAGRHTCIGSAFAYAESTLIIASLVRRFDFSALEPQGVRPAARLTTRPARQIMVKVRHASPQPR
jgi:cytochrome P450